MSVDKMKSLKPRKQRKEYFNAPLHKKRKWISSHLEENLLLKYDRRRITIVKGDAIKVMRGSFKGHEGKITNVNQRRRFVEVEGLVMTKADGKKIAKPIHASNLLITKLNLTDRWRREKLEKNLSEEMKKEIEKEAEEQIIETEKEKKIQEEKEKEKKQDQETELEKTSESDEIKKESKPKKEKEKKQDQETELEKTSKSDEIKKESKPKKEKEKTESKKEDKKGKKKPSKNPKR
jgi:large subunit ribosomal protein L24